MSEAPTTVVEEDLLRSPASGVAQAADGMRLGKVAPSGHVRNGDITLTKDAVEQLGLNRGDPSVAGGDGDGILQASL